MAQPVLASTERRRFGLLLPVLGLAALLVLAFWGWLQASASRSGPGISNSESEMQTRRIDVVLADVQATWTRLVRDEGFGRYSPAGHRFFIRATPSPCAGRDGATGPFYCPAERMLAFDLRFFAALTDQLREKEDKGVKLIVAQQSAADLQDELGILAAVAAKSASSGSRRRQEMELALALQADCLTGIWAADAGDRLGPVPPGLYSAALQGTRRVAEAQAEWGHGAPWVRNSLGLGLLDDREAAFAKGYAAGTLAACLAIDPTH